MKTNVIAVSILITLGVVSGRIHKLETHVSQVISNAKFNQTTCIHKIYAIYLIILIQGLNVNVASVFQNDVRRYFALTTFGFYKGGILSVNLTNFKVKPFNENDVVSKQKFFLVHMKARLLNVTYRYFFNIPVWIQFRQNEKRCYESISR